VVDGERREAGTLVIREAGIELPDGEKVELERLRSLEGWAKEAVVPREAMGMGDVHLMGVIGLAFGWSGVLFSLLASSLFAIAAATLWRIGFGRPLPYGPFLALGALVWLLGGWELGRWYFEALR